MLVLTRKTGQTINIGDDIRIKILEIGNGYIKLGIEAPKDMPIYREELYEKLKQLNRESARMNIDSLKNFLGLKEEK